jgi:hypothetical protein
MKYIAALLALTGPMFLGGYIANQIKTTYPDLAFAIFCLSISIGLIISIGVIWDKPSIHE